MIKKYLILLIGLCFFASPVWAISPQILQLAGEGDCSIGIAGECEEEQEENIQYAAADAWAISPAIFGNMGQRAAGGDCDDCSGTLSVAAHFENDDDLTQGTPCGCSDNDITWAKNGVTYSETQKQDGSYSAYNSGSANQYLKLSITNSDLISPDEGKLVFEVYFSDSDPSGYDVLFHMEGTGTRSIKIYESAGNIVLYRNPGNGDSNASASWGGAWGQWLTVTARWKHTADPSLSIDIEGTSGTNSGTLNSWGESASEFYTCTTFGDAGDAFYIDNFKVYSVSDL